MVLVDACVLFSASLRDLLMHLAIDGLIRPRWSNEIHDEWIDAVLKSRTDLSRQKLHRTRDLMNAHVVDALVTGFEPLIPTLLLPDPNDRHVLAAAIHAGATDLLTFNLSDFPPDILARHSIDVWHPDDFLLRLFQLQPTGVMNSVRRQRLGLRNPPMTVTEFLGNLEQQGIPQTVSVLRSFADSI